MSFIGAHDRQERRNGKRHAAVLGLFWRGNCILPGACIMCRAAMPILTIRHVTTYHYRHPVSFGEHRMMLRPRDSYDQRLIEVRLDITPQPVALHWVHDVFGNCVAIARFSETAQELRFDSTIRLDHSPTNALDFELEDYARIYPFTYPADESPDLLRLIERLYLDPDRVVDRWARQFLRNDGRSEEHT